MSSWNYRVVHRKILGRTPEFDEDYYAIHEVYYDEDGKMVAVTADAVPAHSEDMKGLAWVIERFAQAYKNDVVEWDSVPEKGAKPFGSDKEPFGINLDEE
jgi:hypothetical protein